jgi:hypothetical protein
MSAVLGSVATFVFGGDAATQPVSPRFDQNDFYRSMFLGVGDNAVIAPFGRFLLIRDGPILAAIRIDEHTRREPLNAGELHSFSYRGAKYTLIVQEDGSGDLAKANARESTGEFVEGSGQPDADAVHVGPLVLRWSASDWIYFPEGHERLEVARTEWVRRQDINPNDPDVRWFTRAQIAQMAHSPATRPAP